VNLTFDLNRPSYDVNNQGDSKIENHTLKLNSTEQALYEKALRRAKNFKNAHSDLLETIMEVDETRLYEKFSLTSTFKYCTDILNLSF